MVKKFLLLLQFLFSVVLIENTHAQQQNQELVNQAQSLYNSVKTKYNRPPSCAIVGSHGVWYFVSYIVPSSDNQDVLNKQLTKQVKDFFDIPMNFWSRYTKFPSDNIKITDSSEAREILKDKKKDYYTMPQIGAFQTSNFINLLVYAKAIGVNESSNQSVVTESNVTTSNGVAQAQQGVTSTNSSTSLKKNSIENSVASKDKVTDNVDNKTITLVVTGSGNTEDEATKVALQKAIEQAYGTFVSSNTSIVNDEMVKDEIVSISTGNIQSYTELGHSILSNGFVSVSVKATVSIGKLVKFAQSKGATTELAGATFAMNMKIRELNKKNEVQALQNMFEKMNKICDMHLFDYNITTDEFQQFTTKENETIYLTKVHILISPNDNYKNLVSEYSNTLNALKLSENEIAAYKQTNIEMFESQVPYWSWGKYNAGLAPFPKGFGDYVRNLQKKFIVELRNNICEIKNDAGLNYIDVIRLNLLKNMFMFKIFDNINNCAIPYCWKTTVNRTTDSLIDNGIKLFSYCTGSGYQLNADIYGWKNTNTDNQKSFLYYLQGEGIKVDYGEKEDPRREQMMMQRRRLVSSDKSLFGFQPHVSGCPSLPTGINCDFLTQLPTNIIVYVGYNKDSISNVKYIKVEPVNEYKTITVSPQN